MPIKVTTSLSISVNDRFFKNEQTLFTKQHVQQQLMAFYRKLRAIELMFERSKNDKQHLKV